MDNDDNDNKNGDDAQEREKLKRNKTRYAIVMWFKSWILTYSNDTNDVHCTHM